MRFRFQGVEFGGKSELLVEDFDPGEPDIRSDDTDRPNRDGVIPGRDFYGVATWGFDLATNRQDITGARETAVKLGAKWKSSRIRLAPNQAVPLSYEMGGVWRRVYGRPDKWAGFKGNVLATLGVGRINADFRVTDPLHYSDEEHQVTLSIVPASAGGLRAPLRSPLRAVASDVPRAGFVVNAGEEPTPLKAVFHGPIRDPWVRSADGWEIGITGRIAYDISITVDPLEGTVTRSDGAPVAGMLTRKTRLTGSKLPPGQSELTFGGVDATGTATVDLMWRDASPIL